MSDPEQAPHSLLYPPEWDAMTADEQMMWFLAHLSSRLDSIRSEFTTARVGAPAEATSCVDPAASHVAASATSTSDLVVSHTDRATTVAPPTIVKKVHDTTIAFDPNPATGTNNTTATLRTNGVEIQEENQVMGTATQAVSITIGGKFTTPAPPLVASCLIVSTEHAVLPDVSSSTGQAEEILYHVSSDYNATTLVTCSTECSNKVSAMSFLPPVMTASLPPAATLALVADLVHPATNDGSNRRVPLVMEDEFLTSPSPVMFSVVDSMQSFVNHDRDFSLPTRHEGLLIRPMPWPSFQMHLADRNDVRPVPWLSFACSFEGTTLNYEGLMLQVTYVVQRLPVALNFLREYWKYLPSVRLKSCPCENLAGWDPMVPKYIPLRSQRIIQLSDEVYWGAAEWWSVSSFVQSFAVAIPMEETFSLQTVETWQYIPDDLRLPVWPPINPENYGSIVVKEKLGKGGHIVQPTCVAAVGYMFEHSTIQIWELFLCFERSSDQKTPKAKQKQFAYKNLQFGPPELFEKVACWITTIPRDIPAPNHKMMQIIYNLNLCATERSSGFFYVQPSYEFHAQDAQLLFEFSQETIQLKPFWPSFSCDCRAVQILSMSAHWNFLSQEDSEGSSKCKYEQLAGAPKAIIQLAAWISFEYCSFKSGPHWILLVRPPAGEPISNVCCSSVAHWNFQSLKKSGALRTEFLSSVFLRFMQFWPLHSFAPSSITMQWQGDKHPSQEKHSQPYASSSLSLGKFALVRKMKNNGSHNLIVRVIIPSVHTSNTCYFGTILVLDWSWQGVSVKQLQETTPCCAILVLNLLGPSSRYKSGACSPARREDIQAAVEGCPRCYCSCDLTNASVVLFIDYPVDEVHKSVDLRSITISMTTSDLQPPKIVLLLLISKRAPAMSGTASLTCYNQDHFQEGRGVIAFANVFAQASSATGTTSASTVMGYFPVAFSPKVTINHNTYFTRVSVGHDYYYLKPDSFSKRVQVHLNHDCYRDSYHWDPGMIKNLQAPWDPGEVLVIAAWGQAAFQEGRDVTDLR